MPQTETPVSQLKINELTKTQFDNASTLSETELYAVDPQFTGGKLLKTDTNGDIIESSATEADATAGGTAIQSISLGGTGQTPDANKNVNIPLATNSYIGVCRGSTPNGVIASAGVLSTVAASDAELQTKTQAYHPVVPSHLDVAIREGLGNNSLTWTDAYKTSARNTIDAEAKATIQTLSATDSITLTDNTIYNGGEQTSLTIALPSTVDVSFLCEIDFSSGATATTLSYPNTIIWIGDDVSSNLFIPVVSKRYTVIIAYDGVNYRATVKGV